MPPTSRVTAHGLLLVLMAGCATPGEHGVDRMLGAARAYVANTHSESLTVIDESTRSAHTTLALHARPHGLAASADGRHLYVTSSGGHGEVIAIDTATHDILWRLDVGTSLHQPALAGNDRLLFAPDFARNVVAVVDVGARRLEREITMPDDDGALVGLHNAYAGARGRYVYQTAIYSGAIARIDVADRAVDRTYRIDGHPRPAAILADESKAYVQLSELHGFIEIDLASGRETRRVEWPIPVDAPRTDARCHGIGLSPDETELWAASSLTRDVRILDLPELVEQARIPLGGTPQWIAFSRNGEAAYLTLTTPDQGTGAVAVIDRRTRQVVANVQVGREPKRILTLVVSSASQPETAGAVDPR